MALASCSLTKHCCPQADRLQAADLLLGKAVVLICILAFIAAPLFFFFPVLPKPVAFPDLFSVACILSCGHLTHCAPGPPGRLHLPSLSQHCLIIYPTLMVKERFSIFLPLKGSCVAPSGFIAVLRGSGLGMTGKTRNPFTHWVGGAPKLA